MWSRRCRQFAAQTLAPPPADLALPPADLAPPLLAVQDFEVLKREAVQKVEESFDKAKQSAARWAALCCAQCCGAGRVECGVGWGCRMKGCGINRTKQAAARWARTAAGRRLLEAAMSSVH